MAERLTIKQNNDKYYFVNCDINDIPKKLGELEDILEKYNIESVEALDGILEKYFFDTWITVAPKIVKNWELISDIIASDKLSRDFELGIARDRDTWQKACELACDAMTKLGGDDCCGCRLDKKMCDICGHKKALFDYFYQQAKQFAGK